MHYDTIEAAGRDAEQVQVPGGAIKAKKFKARRVDRKSDGAHDQRGRVLAVRRAEAIPFGLARWTTKTTIDAQGQHGRAHDGLQTGHASDRRDVRPRVGHGRQKRIGRN